MLCLPLPLSLSTASLHSYCSPFMVLIFNPATSMSACKLYNITALLSPSSTFEVSTNTYVQGQLYWGVKTHMKAMS